MIIKCQYCKKEFDKPSRKNQHEKDAHMQGAKRLESLGVFVGRPAPSTLDEQIATAQAEMATWTPERIANCRLDGQIRDATPSTPVATIKEQ
jgi:hypothetical protein